MKWLISGCDPCCTVQRVVMGTSASKGGTWF